MTRCHPQLRIALAIVASVVGLAAPPATATAVVMGGAETHEKPRWLDDRGAAALALIDLVKSASADGLDPRSYDPAELNQLVGDALRGPHADRVAAEERLTEVFARYAADVARPRDVSTLYVDPAAGPRPVSVARLTAVAAGSPNFEDFVRTLGWMHPYYGQLRQALRSELAEHGDPTRASRLRLNLERARILPRGQAASIVVNTAAARLEYFEGGKVRDSMRVVVGKAAQQTPMMAGVIRYAIVNPYWHVPPDLSRELIAPRVLKEGLPYLQRQGYQLVTDWSETGRIVAPSDVDWKAVASGKTEIFVRQLPGPANSMGKVKFMFPNELGIYLHDSPAKALFEKDARQFSAGCVRLEDADRLQALLLPRAPKENGQQPEHIVALPDPVPVYLTYLTMFPQNVEIVERPDVYGRDHAALNSIMKASRDAG